MMEATEDPVRILPKEERIKNDYVFMLSKFGESFVGSDNLRKSVLLEELSRFRATNDLYLENSKLKDSLNEEISNEKKLRKTYDLKQEKLTKEIGLLRKKIMEEKSEKIKMMEQMVKLLEKEKGTRERILEYMEDDNDDDEETKKEDNKTKKDRLAQNFEDVCRTVN